MPIGIFANFLGNVNVYPNIIGVKPIHLKTNARACKLTRQCSVLSIRFIYVPDDLSPKLLEAFGI